MTAAPTYSKTEGGEILGKPAEKKREGKVRENMKQLLGG
jgi:hypothetical protein